MTCSTGLVSRGSSQAFPVEFRQFNSMVPQAEKTEEKLDMLSPEAG